MSVDIVKISKSEDWATLKGLGADVVLDPVILRTAHLFLLGRTGTDKPDEVWKAIEKNIGALAAFVDAAVLSEQIPVFNYGSSYDLSPLPPDAKVQWRPEPAELFGVCSEALTAVHISLKAGPTQGEYFTLVTNAYNQVADHAPLPHSLVQEVVTRLRTFGYAWEPRKSLPEAAVNALTPALASYDSPFTGDTDANTVKDYLAGCLIFSGFAQKLGGDHVFPPDWSRLYAATALPETEDEAKLTEEALFRRLAKVGNTNQLGIGRTVQFDQPTFLPYLLERDDTATPEALFRRAIDLREDDDVQQYIQFRQTVRQEAEERGRAETFLREIDELVRVAERVMNKTPRRWPVKMGVSVSLPEGVSGSAEPGKELELFRPYDWSMRQLPTNRYRKLLLRLVISQQRTSQLKNLVKKRWDAA
jgi:hypothetical protein